MGDIKNITGDIIFIKSDGKNHYVVVRTGPIRSHQYFYVLLPFDITPFDKKSSNSELERLNSGLSISVTGVLKKGKWIDKKDVTKHIVALKALII